MAFSGKVARYSCRSTDAARNCRLTVPFIGLRPESRISARAHVAVNGRAIRTVRFLVVASELPGNMQLRERRNGRIKYRKHPFWDGRPGNRDPGWPCTEHCTSPARATAGPPTGYRRHCRNRTLGFRATIVWRAGVRVHSPGRGCGSRRQGARQRCRFVASGRRYGSSLNDARPAGTEYYQARERNRHALDQLSDQSGVRLRCD